MRRTWWTDEVARLLGDMCAGRREMLGLTQESVATAIGSHRPIVARFERGKHLPKWETLMRYFDLLGLDMTDLSAVLDAVGDPN